MPVDFDNIAGLRRGASFIANEFGGRDFLQDGYDYKIASPLTFDCPPDFPGFPPTTRPAAWTTPGVDPHTLDLRTETVWDDSLLVPAENPALEGVADETLDEYVARVGLPDFLVCGGFGDIAYSGYFSDCSTFVDPGFPAYGMELDGDGVSFGSGERGLLAAGIGAEGVHGQGALAVVVAKAVASYSGDPTNDATLCLFAWDEFAQVVLYFEDAYVAHLLQNDAEGHGFNVRTYWRISPESPDSQLMCVL